MIVLVGFHAETADALSERIDEHEVVSVTVPGEDPLVKERSRLRALAVRIGDDRVAIDALDDALDEESNDSIPLVLCLESHAWISRLQSRPWFRNAELIFEPVDPDRLRQTLERAIARSAGRGRGGSELDDGEGERPGPDPDSVALVEEAIGGLWERFREHQIQRVSVLEELALALLDGDAPSDLRARSVDVAHKLAGSLGTFGLSEAGEAARTLEGLLEDEEAFESVSPPHIAETVLRIREAVERGPGSSPSAGRVESESATADLAVEDSGAAVVLVVAEDPSFAQRLTSEAPSRGMRVLVAGSLRKAGELLEVVEPEALILDLAVAGPGEDVYAFLQEVARSTPSPPVITLSTRDSFVDRVVVARRGGHRFLEKPVTVDRVLSSVAEVLQASRDLEVRLLAVDDDPAVHGILRAALADEAIQITHVQDPLRFWDALEATDPDLLLLDLVMPNVSGLEICRVVRGDPRWQGLPVLVLTARTDDGVLEEVFEAGADDYVAKPVRGRELAARIQARIKRIQLARRYAEVDELTGIASRRKSDEQINRYLKLAKRHDQPMALAFLDVDRMKRINDRHGHPVGDRCLRHLADHLSHAFRGEDVVARWGGEEFAVAMYGMSKSDGVHRIASVLDGMRDDPVALPGDAALTVTFSAGVASYPEDGDSIRTLYREADRALHQAKADGRARVVAIGSAAASPSDEDQVDVVVVEDDDAVAGLLLHALETRSYRTAHLEDGPSAVAALTGPDPAVRARLILLDVNLPGLDGLTVLRRLAADGVTDRSRVVVLTARVGEDEVLAALDAGAFDHIAKPFSIPVLMRRVRRALHGT